MIWIKNLIMMCIVNLVFSFSSLAGVGGGECICFGESCTSACLETTEINVISPTSNQQIKRDSSAIIRWESGSSIDNVDIQLYRNGSISSVETLIKNTRNDGIYTWVLPKDGVIGDTFKIRISSHTNWGTIFDYSELFSIAPSSGDRQLHDQSSDESFKDPDLTSPYIKVNGLYGEVVISSTENSAIDVDLVAANNNGKNAEYWVYANTDFGTYSWVYPEGWVSGVHPTIQIPVIDVDNFNISNIPLPPGYYTVHFDIDNQPDGENQQTWSSSVDVTVVDGENHSGDADIWVSLNGKEYGIAEGGVSGDPYIRDSQGNDVKPSVTVAGQLLFASDLVNDIKKQDFYGLSDTLDEVVYWSKTAGVVNTVGKFAEEGLEHMASTAVQSVLAPATGGASVATQVSGTVVNAFKLTDATLDTAKFALSIGLIRDTQQKISTYLNSRESLLKKIYTGTPVPYQDIIELWKAKEIISIIAPFSAKTALNSVNAAQTDSFFTNITITFGQIFTGAVAKLTGVPHIDEAAGIGVSSFALAESISEVGDILADVRGAIESIQNVTNNSEEAMSSIAISLNLAKK